MDDRQKILLESGTNELEIVEFRIDELDRNGNVVPCYYGVNVAKVREILRRPDTWRVPDSHPAVEGMMKLRDEVITVIDLARILGKSDDGLVPQRVVVLEFNRIKVGVLVHSVSRIYRISWESVEPPVKIIGDSHTTGVVKMQDRIILILDFEKIVAGICRQEALHRMEDDQISAELTLDRGKRRILVADDSRFIRNSLCSTLRTAGYNVEEAENGEEAWEMIAAMTDRCRRAGNTIKSELDMLITDVEMPRMDGLHLTARVKSDQFLRDLPVLIFSSLASEDNRRKWRDLGADDIVTKPDLPNLVKLADNLIK
ncbi:MAG TPA: chemotaxis protein [Geobacteraceae bacterium]|nr:chemotaxis protein [Geobacteraceae bacterium]